MAKVKVRFDNTLARAFTIEVKQRVSEYFEQNNLSKHANIEMVMKTIIILGVFVSCYLLILFGGFSVWQMWGLCVLLGISRPV